MQCSRWFGVSSLPSHLPGCALGALMPSNLAKIARGMLAYGQSSESPGCSGGKPCGKHALNRTRCCMYNVANIRSQASEYHNPNLAHLGASEWGHFRFLKPMRLIIMIGEDVGSRGGAGMMGDNARNQSDPSRCLDLVSNERRSESFVRMRAPGERCARDGEEMAEKGGPAQARSPLGVMRPSAGKDAQFLLSQRSRGISLCLSELAPTAITCFRFIR